MKPTGRTLIGACVVGVAAALTPHGLSAAESRYALKDEPRPSNIRVQETPLGAVFADSRGMTLYTDRQETKPNTPVCLNSVPKREVNDPTDLRGDVPLPPGETCLTKHPAVLVGDAQPVGPWTVLDRPDGIKQWAYNGRAVYTSVKDLVPGHVRMSIDTNLRQGRKRFLPLYAPLDLPPDIGVQPVGFVAKVFATHTGKTLYTLTMDRAGKSACEGACLDKWQPHLGGSLSQARGDWSLVARSIVSV
jgi:predicted lipoprotein with Yx(FWY)xxD motif